MTSRWSRHISTSLQDQCTTSKIFGVSRKEDRFTGLWKTAQTSELLRQISTSVPDLHSVSSQSQQREKMKAGLWRRHRRVNAELALTDTEQINWLEEQHKSIMFHIMSSHLTSVSFSWIFESNDPPAIVKQILLVYETSIQASWMSGVSRDMGKKARVWWSERVNRQSWTLRASRQVTVISSKTRTVSRAVLHRFTDLVNCGVKDNARVITLSHEHHTKGSGRLLRSFPSSLCILSTPSPPLPPMIVHSTDKSTPLHKPSLLNLSLCSCYKTSLQLLGKDLLLQYLFLCRASVDVMVPRGRRGGETASMMRMVAPHWCIVLYSVCVSTLTEGPSPWQRLVL